MTDATIAVAIVSGIVTLLGGFMVWLRTRGSERAKAERDLATGRKAQLEGEATVATAVLAWADRLNAEVQRLSGEMRDTHAEMDALRRELADTLRELAQMRADNDALRRRVQVLTAQVIELGGRPRHAEH